jgi:hypothetical protein
MIREKKREILKKVEKNMNWMIWEGAFKMLLALTP